MDILQTMERKLKAALNPVFISVADDSMLHYGHDGATPGMVSHVAIVLVSPLFEGKSRVTRSRMVFDAIADEIKEIHAITVMKMLTPLEHQS